MTVLELSAIDLNKRSRIACSALCGSFYQPGLAGAGRSEEQKASHRSARNAHPERECLVNAHNLPYRIVLADDLASQAGFELLSLESCLCGIQKVWIDQLRLLHCHLSPLLGSRLLPELNCEESLSYGIRPPSSKRGLRTDRGQPAVAVALKSSISRLRQDRLPEVKGHMRIRA